MNFFNSSINFLAQENLDNRYLPVWIGTTTKSNEYTDLAIEVYKNHGRICALWGSDESVGIKNKLVLQVVFAISAGYLQISLEIDRFENKYFAPDITGVFTVANRMQRACADMLGIVFVNFDENNQVDSNGIKSVDHRPWLLHNGWQKNWYPLLNSSAEPPYHTNEHSEYDFVKVGGEGSHEIPVGPIHAGIIEPGHFRFSVVGERVLRLEERFGYMHRGCEKLFIGKDILFGERLAGRICGDSSVAYAWAFASATERAINLNVSERAIRLRAVLLERERVANHLGDLGALGNDAAFAFGYSQFMRLKENWLRFNYLYFGHRLLFDKIKVGGVQGINVNSQMIGEMLEQISAIEKEVLELQNIYTEHAGLQDRFVTTGKISVDLVRELSLCGMVARACGVPLDSRYCANEIKEYSAIYPYNQLRLNPIINTRGDVASRVFVRFGEIYESLKMLKELIISMPEGELLVPIIKTPTNILQRSGLAIIESFRGEVLAYVEINNHYKLKRVHLHDPSWQLWTALEHAVINDIVPDFPLINKSFNLSYAGADL